MMFGCKSKRESKKEHVSFSTTEELFPAGDAAEGTPEEGSSEEDSSEEEETSSNEDDSSTIHLGLTPRSLAQPATKGRLACISPVGIITCPAHPIHHR